MSSFRVAQTLGLMARLETQGYIFHQRPDGGVRVCPVQGLEPDTVQELREHKPEIAALVAFSQEDREILSCHDVSLEDLRRYRLGLDSWLLLRPEERTLLMGFIWCPEDIQNLGRLVQAVEGAVVEVRREVTG